jgi:hypothetical protein
MAASIREWYTRVYLPSRRKVKEQKVEQAEFERRANEALSGPPNFDRLWKLMKDKGDDVTQIKFEDEGGVSHAIILVLGKKAVDEVTEFLDARMPGKIGG